MNGGACTACPNGSPHSAIGSTSSDNCMLCPDFTFTSDNSASHVEGADREWQWALDPVCNFRFHIKLSSSSGWIGLGISDDTSMANTDVYTVEESGGEVRATNRYTNGQLGAPCDGGSDCEVGITVTATSSESGRISAQMYRDVSIYTENKDVEVVTGKKLIFQYGGSTAFGYHSGVTAQSGDLDVTQSGAIAASVSIANKNEKQMHGSMMVLAWVFLSNTGIFIARYMKKSIGAPQWFLLHRGIQSFAVLFMLIGFIVIKAADLTIGADTHKLLGTLVIVLAIIQTLLGVFRKIISQHDLADKTNPDDHGPRRWLFNYLHWWTGRTLIVLTIITILEGFDAYGVCDDCESLLIVWVAVGVALIVTLEWLRMQAGDMSSLSQQAWHQACAFFTAFSAATAVAIMVALS